MCFDYVLPMCRLGLAHKHTSAHNDVLTTCPWQAAPIHATGLSVLNAHESTVLQAQQQERYALDGDTVVQQSPSSKKSRALYDGMLLTPPAGWRSWNQMWLATSTKRSWRR